MPTKFIRYIVICLSVMMVAPGNSWGVTYNLTTDEIRNNLHDACRDAITGGAMLEMPNGDVYHLFSASGITSEHSCYDVHQGAYADALAGEEAMVVAVYDTYSSQVVFPIVSGSYANQSAFQMDAYSGIVGIAFGASRYAANSELMTGGSCQYNDAVGVGVVMGFKVIAVNNNTDIVIQPIVHIPCLYRNCINGSMSGSGGTFNPDVCCAAGCPANQYGDGCSCTNCPTMVNKAGQTVSGTSSAADNATISKCTMGTSNVFSSTTGDWSFSTACPAS